MLKRAGIAVGLVLLLLIGGAGLWIVYENTFTPAALGPSATAARALRAYGGAELWQQATRIESRVTVGGLLFQLKGMNIPAHAEIDLDVRRPHTVINPVDAAGDIGVLDGFSVTVMTRDGRVLDSRADARQHLQNATVSTPWDRLNLLYFLGYAFWGYYTLPYLLTRPDVRWTELADGVLEADFGSGLPVHSRIQRYWFDTSSGLLRRNDYTPVAAAATARVANIVFAHGSSGGIPYTSKRRVKLTPSQYGWILPYPDFITIDVESWRLS